MLSLILRALATLKVVPRQANRHLLEGSSVVEGHAKACEKCKSRERSVAAREGSERSTKASMGLAALPLGVLLCFCQLEVLFRDETADCDVVMVDFMLMGSNIGISLSGLEDNVGSNQVLVWADVIARTREIN